MLLLGRTVVDLKASALALRNESSVIRCCLQLEVFVFKAVELVDLMPPTSIAAI